MLRQASPGSPQVAIRSSRLVFCEPWAPEERGTAPAEVLAELSLAHRGEMAIPELVTEAEGCWAVVSGPESGAHPGSLRSELRDEAEMEALVRSGRLMPGPPASSLLHLHCPDHSHAHLAPALLCPFLLPIP